MYIIKQESWQLKLIIEINVRKKLGKNNNI